MNRLTLAATALAAVGCCPNDDARFNANGGCECTGEDGQKLHVVPVTFCPGAPPEGTGTTDDPTTEPALVEVEDNSIHQRATIITPDADWYGTLADSSDNDWFGIGGPDGKRGLVLEIEPLTAGRGVFFNHGYGGSLFVPHPVEAGSTLVLGFGSSFQIAHRFRVTALDGQAPVDYRVRASFVDAAYEFEDNSIYQRATTVAPGVPAGGLINNSADDDWFRASGPDGDTAVTWTVTHLGSYPESDVPLTVHLGRDGALIENFTVGTGERVSLPMSSVFQDNHTVRVRAPEGRVLYTVEPVFSNDRREREDNSIYQRATPFGPDVDWRGRILTGDDVDWFRVRSPEGVDTMSVEIESEDPAAPDLAVQTRMGTSNTIDSRTIAPGATDSFDLPVTGATDYYLLFDASQGIAPYRFRASFSTGG